MEQLKVPDTLPDFAGYRRLVLRALYADPLAQWSVSELDTVTDMVADYGMRLVEERMDRTQENASYHDIPGLATIVEELGWGVGIARYDKDKRPYMDLTLKRFDPLIPKWVMLWAWLQPGALTTLQCPQILLNTLRIAFRNNPPLLPEEHFPFG